MMGPAPEGDPRAGARNLDPRWYQISMLSGLLAYGLLRLDFDLPFLHIPAILAGALGAQYAGARLWSLPQFDPKSALISALSLCLLLRTTSPIMAAMAAYVAVSSKFVLRWDGKHVFNPTNFALVVLLCAGTGWVSPAQWGREAYFAFLVACLGGMVVNRAARSDVTYAFLASYVALIFGRALWLGDPLAIPLHQLQSGALLIFAFFMISDPKTTPDSRAGRLLYGGLVALGALYAQFVLYRPEGLLWALVCLAPTVPLLDRLVPGARYHWNRPARIAAPPPLPAPARARLASSAFLPALLTGRGAR